MIAIARRDGQRMIALSIDAPAARLTAARQAIDTLPAGYRVTFAP